MTLTTVRTATAVNGADTGGTITLTYGAGLSASATKPGTGNYWRAELDRQGTPESVQSATVLRNGSFLTSAPYAQRTTSETLGWDASGNLTNSALYALTFDAEDRLVELKDKANPLIKKTLAYDHLGRRVEEKDHNSADSLTKHRRFVWTGWMLLAEVDVNVGTGVKTVNRTFTWGPDATGTVHGAAGIGGLLLVDKSSTEQFVAAGNARGDVTVLLDALGTSGTPALNLKAGAEYAPYGELVRGQGDLSLLPFRFQSKWLLGQNWNGAWPVELLDFGRRTYSPALGRFISRDPKGEAGGANLYNYCGNDPVNRLDALGEYPRNQPLIAWDPVGFIPPTVMKPQVVNGYLAPPETRAFAFNGPATGGIRSDSGTSGGGGGGGENGQKDKKKEQKDCQDKEAENGDHSDPFNGTMNGDGRTGALEAGKLERLLDRDDGSISAGSLMSRDILDGPDGVHNALDQLANGTEFAGEAFNAGSTASGVGGGIKAGAVFFSFGGVKKIAAAGKAAWGGIRTGASWVKTWFVPGVKTGTTLTRGELSKNISVTQRGLLHDLIGNGAQGAQNALQRLQGGDKIPDGLSRQTLETYKAIAEMQIARGRDTGTQAERLKVIEEALKQCKD